MSSTENEIGANSGQVSYVGVKPPPFWKTNPSLWFIRLEAQFSLAKITSETTKFNHVVAAVEADVLTSVSDIIVNPPEEQPYEALKKRLIESHSESEESKIRTLLQGVELGDSRPSHLLARMRALAGDAVGEALLKSLWLARLPTTTRSIVGALSDGLSKLAAVADKIHDLSVSPQINEAACLPQAQNSALEIQIAQLTQQVNDLAAIVRGRSRSRDNNYQHYRKRSYSGSRNRSRNRYKEPANNMCFYHTNFGAKARKCNFPCSFKEEN